MSLKSVTNTSKIGLIGDIPRYPDRAIGFTLLPITGPSESPFAATQIDASLIVLDTNMADKIEAYWTNRAKDPATQESLEDFENEIILARWNLGSDTALILAGDAGGGDISQEILDDAMKSIAPRLSKNIFSMAHFSADKLQKSTPANIKAAFKALAAPAPQTLTGQSFVVTGTLSRPRSEIEQDIRSRGGQVSNTVTAKTSYLVAGDNTGATKISKASALGVKTISEAQLNNLLSAPNTLALTGPALSADTVLFHATERYYLPHIRRAGLKGPVFLGTKAIAEYFAGCIKDEGKEADILSVSLESLDPAKMTPDSPGIQEPITMPLKRDEEDIWADWESSGQTWQDSLQIVGSICYEGNITPEQIYLDNKPLRPKKLLASAVLGLSISHRRA